MTKPIVACPNDPSHKTFIAVAAVYQDWLVDETGKFIKVHKDDGDVIDAPRPEEGWNCATCRELATVLK